MIKKLLSIIMVFNILLSGFSVHVYASNHANFAISIDRIDVAKELKTTKNEQYYDGTIVSTDNIDTAPDGEIYAIININVQCEESTNLENLKLKIDGKLYNRIEDNSFLQNHGYTTLSDILTTTMTGYVSFLIPEDYLESEKTGWSVCLGDYESDAYIGLTEVSLQNGIVEQHEILESAILEDYNKNGKRTLDNALVYQNIYGTAPLTAVILFETSTSDTVTVSVAGKTEDTTISYTTAANTHHEVQIFGLYPNYLNKVTLTTSSGNSRLFEIQTEPMPEDMTTVKKLESNGIQLNDNLFFVCDGNRTVFDKSGDIRWYMYNIEKSSPNGIEEFDFQTGNFWFSTNPYSANNATIYCMSFTGKVQGKYIINGLPAHHDASLTPDGKLLYLSKIGQGELATISSLDPKTGSVTEYLDLLDIIDSSLGSLEYSTVNTLDYFHPNTVEYVKENNSLLISLRNHHMVLNIDYSTKNINWILTSALKEVNGKIYAIQENLTEYLILPEENDEEFEWFYSQHDPTLVSYDKANGIFDLVLFDNGTDRFLPTQADDPDRNTEKYSRIVHYQIDEKSKTVKQIYQYGKEEGENIYSTACGSAQFLHDNSHYIANFWTDNTISGVNNLSRVTETAKDGTVVASYQIGNTLEGSYRTYSIPFEKFIVNGNVFSDVIKYTEYYKMGYEFTENNGSLPIKDEIEVTIKDIAITQSGFELYGEGDILSNIDGWNAFSLIATGEQGQYIIPLVNINKKQFYTAGIDISQLPKDVYKLGIYIWRSNDIYGYTEIPYKITINKVINEDVIYTQKKVNESISSSTNTYTIDKPNISVDAYGIAPLSAILSFTTSKPASITVEVESKNGAKPVTNVFETVSTEHQIPIYGLYENEATNVKLTAHYKDGTSETSTISVTGNSLPSDFVPVSITEADTAQMADGWTFIMAGSLQGYVYAIDETGAVRWMLSEKGLGAAGSLLPLSNGNYLIGGDKSFGQYYKYNLFELNMTGQIINEYLVNGYHHDAQELPNGNLLILANNVNGDVVEDTMYEIERSTGAILRTWDLNSYFNVGNYNNAGQHVSDVNYGSDTHDWLHTNGMEYDESTNSVLISARHQDAVFSMSLETGDINWILSNPDDLWPEYLKEKLLKPTDDNFEWQYGQHNISLLPNGDIMMFDNGDYRSKNTDGVLPATEGYSRAVVYRIDKENMTVSQVWQFGKELGSAPMAAYVSSSQYLGENHYLIDFGGIVKDSNGNATYNIMDGIQGSSQSQIYEVKDGKIIFHASVERSGLHGNTYRAARMMPYSSTAELDLINAGNRLGGLYRYGLAETVKFDSSIAVSGAPEVEVSDNGVQLQITSNLGNTGVKSDLAMIFANDEAAYKITLPSDTNIAYTLNNSEIPTGTYKLYLVKDNITYDLKLDWTNSSNYYAFPTGYNIVVKSNLSDDLVYGSGIYYANTPFTVSAVTNDGYKFEGWYVGDKLVSTNANYTITATSDMTITAKFSGYTDIKKTDWYYDAVNYASENGIMTGYSETQFAPNDKLSRAQACQVIYNIADANEQATEDIFSDVPLGQWYTNAISWSSKNGVVSGYGNNLFGPDDTITREQMAAILYRYVGAPSVEADNLGNYTDANQISDWATDALNWCVENKIMVGNGNGTMTPNKVITRAEVATIMMNYFINMD